MRWISLVILAFFFGIFGGIFADQILWPYFIEKPLFYKYRLDKAPIYIVEKREIKIEESEALKEAIRQVKGSTFFVRTKLGEKKLEGSGFILTSDGLAITLSELVPQKGTFSFFVENEVVPFEILKRDEKNNLALIKLEKKNLKTTGFFDFEKLQLGERIFFLAKMTDKEGLKDLTGEGIVVNFDQNLIETNISETKRILGAPVFNFKGEFLGLSFLKDNKIFIIPVTKIRDFTKL